MSMGRNRAPSSATSGLTCSRALRQVLACPLFSGNNRRQKPHCELLEMASAVDHQRPGCRKKAKAEIQAQAKFHFDAGANEVWLCAPDGGISFLGPTAMPSSRLCPQSGASLSCGFRFTRFKRWSSTSSFPGSNPDRVVPFRHLVRIQEDRFFASGGYLGQ
jgi:hypothetical protein